MKTQMDAYFFIAFVGLFATVDGWVNAYDGPFTFQCQPHEYISYIASIHDNSKEDRIWDFRCSSLSTLNVNTEYFNTETCSWSEYVNNFDEPVVYQCPNKHFLAGFSSYHDNHYEDRRWKFYCCEIQGLHLEDCNYSGYVNSLDHPMAYTVPAGKILKGAVSINYDHEEDRVWEYEECNAVEFETGVN